MKRKISLFVIIVVIALLFTSCGSSGTSYKRKDGGMTYLYLFKTDGTVEYRMEGTEDGINYNLALYSGTYTGDATKDGQVSITFTKVVGSMTNIQSGQTKITNKEFPLNDIASSNQSTFPITISGGKFTFGDYEFKK